MNQLYYGDNMQVLREHIVDKSVDRIYFDLKIAQSFSCGVATQQIKKSRRDDREFSSVPFGTLTLCQRLPSHEWLGYFRGRKEQRAEHPDCEPDLNFKKAKQESNAAQKELGV
jgi:hypothetical protein